MKNILTIILIIFSGLQVAAQVENQLDDNKVYSFVQRKAEPIEGMAGFYQSYTKKFNSTKFSSSTGTLDVRLRFVVEKDGTFSDIQVLNENTEGLGEEAIRVLKTMPAWKPATHNGKIVRSVFTLPMKIRVNEEDEKTEESQEKALNKTDEKNEVISETYIKMLDSFVVKTDLFEFKCNCVRVDDDFNQEYRFESQDKKVYYQVSIEQKDEKEVKKNIEEVKKNVLYQGGVINEIQLSGIKATEISLSTKGVGVFSNVHLILLYQQGYFIAISVSSYNLPIADVASQHFIKTFKLKI